MKKVYGRYHPITRLFRLPREHEDIVAGVAAGKHRVEVEVFDFSYGLYVDGGRVASFAEGRISYREWATRRGRINPSLEDRLDHDIDELLA
jgi:hypothetical protein